VEKGGVALITPFTAYQSWDGVFRGDGLGANLQELTRTLVRTGRRMGTASGSGRKDQFVQWAGTVMNDLSPVGIDGYCEFMEVGPQAEVLARFKSDDSILDRRPAAILRKMGKGKVIKLGFWPKDDSVLRLFGRFLGEGSSLLSAPLPPGTQAVPRTDNSLFVVNTASKQVAVRLGRAVKDRIGRKDYAPEIQLPAYGVLWLE
jgi:hypothetical protein